MTPDQPADIAAQPDPAKVLEERMQLVEKLRGSFIGNAAGIELLVHAVIMRLVDAGPATQEWLEDEWLSNLELGRKVQVLKSALKAHRPELIDADLFTDLEMVRRFRQTLAHGVVHAHQTAVYGGYEGNPVSMVTRKGQIQRISSSDIARNEEAAERAVLKLHQLIEDIMGLWKVL